MIHPRRNRGMTLIELLVYVAVFAVVLNVSISVFVRATRLSLLGTRTVDEMRMIGRIGQDFTETVRGAKRVCAEAGPYTTTEDTLVVELPSPAGEGRRYAALGVLNPVPRFGKVEFTLKDGVLQVQRGITYPLDLDEARFEYNGSEPANTRSVSLRLLVKREVEAKKPRLGSTFQASMRAIARGGAL